MHRCSRLGKLPRTFRTQSPRRNQDITMTEPTQTSHKHAQTTPPRPAVNPLLVEVTRGSMVESRHRAAVAVVDVEGRVVLSAGDVEALVYPRSAIKPLQALGLVESGAAEAFGCDDKEIALACASHNGEAAQAEAVAAWLERIGCTEGDLECGPQLPTHQASLEELLRAGGGASALRNNCSGKHVGFLTLAKHLKVPTKGYILWEHPVQQTLLGILEMMCGLDLRAAPRGIDGCGIPQIGIPLGNLALAMARFADPADQPERRQVACARIAKAMTAEPYMVAGTGRMCTRVLAATGGRALVKTGAEGVYCAALPELGLGLALKVDDGATRASEFLLAQLLQRLDQLDSAAAAELKQDIAPVLHNRVGLEVGQIQRGADWSF